MIVDSVGIADKSIYKNIQTTWKKVWLELEKFSSISQNIIETLKN